MITKSKMSQRTLKKMEKISGVKLTFGKLIWSIRMCDEISQVDFARKLKISRQHLCDIEHDRKFVSPKLAAHYARVLGYLEEQFIQLSLQFLIDRDGLNMQVEIAKKKDNLAA